MNRPSGVPARYSDDEWADRVDAEIALRYAREEARRVVEAELRPPASFPEVLTLQQRLAQPPDPVRWRVEGWLPAGGRAVLAAPAKAGKTHAALNLVRCLVDGSPWLGRDPVTQVIGTVVVIDFEMTERQLYDWYREVGITAPERVIVLSMRGRAAAFDLRDEDLRRRWSELLVALDAEFVVWDCLRPVVDALGLDENHDASALLTAFDSMLADAGWPDALVVHHMGHAAERARGDSGIIGWGDANWKLVLDGGDELGARYISANGRDVAQPETQVGVDPVTRRLRVLGGNRAAARMSAASSVVVEILSEAEGPLTKATIEARATAVPGVTRQQAREALAQLVAMRQVRLEVGERNAQLHTIEPQFASSPDLAASSPADYPVSSPPLYSGELANRAASTNVGELAAASSTGAPTPEQAEILARIAGGAQ